MLRTELIRPLPELLKEHASRFGGKVAFSDARRRVSYAQLELRTRHLAGHLTGLRIQPGDRAAILLGNCVEAVESYLAITRANAIGVPLNPHSTDTELAYMLSDSGVRAVITDEVHVDQLRRVIGDAPHPQIIVTGDARVPVAASSFEVMATTEPEAPAHDDLGLDETAWMLYTSGTTGKPKGVLSTQRNCLWSVAACYAPVSDLTFHDRVLWPLPLFHSLSHIACVLSVTAVGASARITDGYAVDELLTALQEESPTLLAGVPTMYHHLLQAAQQKGSVHAPDLRIGLVGGAVTTQSLRSAFEDTFDVPLVDAYGSTETCGSITVNWPNGARVEGSCGLPVPGLNVRLVDPETGRDVPVGEEGEVWVSGPSVMEGYHNKPDETALALQGGWFHTGDLARRDEAGYFVISGRIKDLIIRGGENIHPGEVEEVLRSVPGVADVAVAGKPHDILGEVPVAFLVPGPEGLDTEALFTSCREQLSYFKVPEELYEVARIPRTRSGKTTRHVLLDEPARLRAAGSSYYESLFRVDWVPLSTPPAGIGAPAGGRTWTVPHHADGDLARGLETVGARVTRGNGASAEVTVLRVPPSGDADRGPAQLVESVAAEARSWLLEDRPETDRLVVLTREAVRMQPADTPDPAQAAVAGLIRALQAEHGPRLLLVDVEAEDAVTGRLLPTALTADEPHLAIRGGTMVKPSLERLATGTDSGFELGPLSTVVVTGADTDLGAAMARHLVAGHGIGQLLLISGRGEGDLAVSDLAGELATLRARVTVGTCDMTDQPALRAALASVPGPITAWVHVPSGDVDSAMSGALALDELTSKMSLKAFVLLSSAEGTLGVSGRPEDSALAGFFDALALRRRARNLPAVSLSLGPWSNGGQPQSLATPLPSGVGTLTRRDLPAVVDAALLADEPAVLPMKLDVMAMHGSVVPAVLRGLIEIPHAEADSERTQEFRAKLDGLSDAERMRSLLSTVCATTAEVGGLAADGVAPDRAFKEFGFTSVQAVGLRNRLVEVTGRPLPATLAFDYPTPRALARFVLEELWGGAAEEAEATVAGRLADTDPIAVVGMACRLPGGIASPEDLWTFVEQELDGITPFPTDRGWDVDGIYDPDPEQAGKTYVRDGGFLEGATGFDAGFFRISPREALAMDPQQRVFLETSWEVFERAGIDVTSLHGSRTGVFAGVMNQEYGTGLTNSADETEGYQSTGTAASVVSGRVAYAFGFEGPAVTVDTACSSSLVAVHLARQSLHSGESDLALAGGVAVMARPSTFIEFSRQRGLAPDGRCKAFAAAADGTGWSEGVAVLLLERLSDAHRNGHPVLATIQGSAVNQDGASNGLTAPNGPSQQRVITTALANAGLTTTDIDLVEAHGTGTTLGDPIEAQALINTYGTHREPDHPLWLGSLKSNIGHTQAAAGAAGIIKTILAMHHHTMPATLHIDAPTPHVDWTAGTVQLLTQPQPWHHTHHPRRAAVSAFGVSGTNAHIILEETPTPHQPETASGPTPTDHHNTPETTAITWPLSAATPTALKNTAQRLLDHLHTHPELTPAHTAHLLNQRPHLEHRATVTGTHKDDLTHALTALTHDTPHPQLTTGTPLSTGKTVFVFPGQGTQWPGMGADLLTTSPVFADTITACENALAPYCDWSLTGVIRQSPHAPTLDRVDVLQPTTFALMVALARLWQHHGIHPDAVIGHSQGEIAAAHIAGALTLQDATQIVALRSQAIARHLAGHGAMMSIPLPHTDVEHHLTPHHDTIEIATINGPNSTVVAGDPHAINTLHTTLTTQGIRARTIAVDYASHTSHVEHIHTELTELITNITPQTPHTPIYSTTDKTWITTPHLTPEYWFRNLRQTVHFHHGINTLADTGHTTYIETSTHPVLTTAIDDTLTHPHHTTPTLRRNHPETTTFHTHLATLHTHTNHHPTWHNTTPPPNPHTPLPTYPFQHHHYWPEPARRALDAPSANPDEVRFWDAVEQEDPAALAEALEVADEGARSAITSALPTLANWRRWSRQKSVSDEWRYRVTWRRLGIVDASRLPGKWLIVLPEGFGADPLVARTLGALRSYGTECVPVEIAGTDSSSLAEQLASEVRGPDAGEYSAVLSFLALDERPHAATPAVPAGLALLAALVPALSEAGVTAPLWCVTAGGSDGERGPELAPVQALTWGFGLVAALEYPRTWGGLVDLPSTPDDKELRLLAGVLRGQGDEDQVAIRSGNVLGRRLVRAPLRRSGADPDWSPRGTVLITGGTGGVGGRIARRLAQAGAEHLLLLSRRGLGGDGAAELVEELEACGATVTVASCDVADRAALAAVVAAVPADLPLTAVVHAAGIGQNTSIAETSQDEFARIVSGKAGGARNLDEVLGDRALDAFVLISSNAGVWGGGGQGAYAAANAYLDALAAHRRRLGRTATSLAWGSWAGAGLGAVDGAAERLRRLGLPPMDPAAAMSALLASVAHDETAVSIAHVDWQRFTPGFTSARPSALLSELPEAQAALRELDTQRGDQMDPKLAERLAKLSADDREQAVVDVVQAHAAAVLGHRDPSVVQTQTAFRDQGFDSMTAVQLRNALVRHFGLRLPATLAFDYPTPRALARFVLEELWGGAAEEAEATVAGRVADTDPIAVVGMACRLPGGIASPEDLWELLLAGGEALSDFPTDRGWDVDGIYDPEPGLPGKTYTRRGGFLEGAAAFDPAFFKISPREALAMDPQHRLMLEASWEVFERAGIDVTSLHGSRTGVFAGGFHTGYTNGADLIGEQVDGYTSHNNLPSVLSGRVAYAFGFEGPAVTVDTACSSSLVAVHLARQSLHSGESDLALAGGVAVMARPSTFIEFSRQRGLAPDGRCKAFAAAADGTGWSEGVAVLLLERLSDAHRNGHPVLATIQGSAVNQDGASNGLTAPNGPSQQRVITTALANAGLTTTDIDLVEAHGTGTTLGDPIEAQALINTYGTHREPDHPLWLGSLKSNIGHTQAAAGAAGIIKTILAMHHHTMPATLHIDAPTPHVDWTAGTVQLLTQPQPWHHTHHPRRAAVSAFGVSGTNAHIILEETPTPHQPETASGPTPTDHHNTPETTAITWPLSAATPTALKNTAQRLLDHLHTHPELTPAHTAHLLNQRPHLEHRATVTGTHKDDLTHALTALTHDTPHPQLTTGTPLSTGKTVFVFPGQGTQWPGMGADLLTTSPVFADTITACENALAPYCDWSLTGVIRQSPHAPTLDRVDVLQPTTFALMVALARLWQHHGIHPDAVIGHSQGEIAAAHIAGALTLQDATQIVALRSQAIARHLAGHGAMMSIPLPHTDVEHHLTPHHDTIEIATINGPNSTVVAGDPHAINTLHTTLTTQGIRARTIAVDYASHTSHVEHIHTELTELITNITPQTPHTPIYSTTDKTWITTPHLTPEYWFRNLRQTVHFHHGINTLADTGHTTYIETSTHPVLTTAIDDTLTHPHHTTPTLRRNHPETTTFHTHLATLHTHTNHHPTWHNTTPPPNPHTPLPTYPFQHHHYWLKAVPAAGDLATVGLGQSGHPLLGAVLHAPDSSEVQFTNRVSLSTHPWLADHVVSGSVLVPGTALLELVLRAGDEAGATSVSELVIERPLVLPTQDSALIRVVVGKPDSSGLRPATVHSRADADADWTRHVTALLDGTTHKPPETSAGAWPPPGAVAVATEDFYTEQRAAGFAFGPLFRGLRAVWVHGDEVYAEVGLPDDVETGGFLLHPALLDASLHAAAFLPGRSDAPPRLPFTWEGAAVHATGARALRVRMRPVGEESVAVRMTDATGSPVASIDSLTMRPLDPAGLERSDGAGDMLFRTEWTPLHTDAGPEDGGISGHLLDLTAKESEPSPGLTTPLRARSMVDRALTEIQRHLIATERDAPLVILTQHARRDPAMAAVWGLVRTAQSENPGEVVLVDLDGTHASRTLLPAAVATGEPQSAIDELGVRVPRLTRFRPEDADARPLDPEGTVLITGGTGTLGALIARRLVTHHGVRHLLLVSRRGPAAPLAQELHDELTGLGAKVTIRAADAGHWETTAELIADIAADHPLTAVIHTAAVLDDGLVTALDSERVDTVFRPKVDGAWYLHELTKHLDLSAFVLFSSASGTLGNAGQGNYAAGNGFLDGLAALRRAQGLPVLSLAWGLWEQASEMTGALLEGTRGHLKQDVLTMSTEEGLLLFDTAMRCTDLPQTPPVLIPVKLNLPAIREAAEPPAVVRGLIPSTRPTVREAAAEPADSFLDQLRRLAPEEQTRRLINTVVAHASATLGHRGTDGIGERQAFRDLGFDSLAAVDLRNRLGTVTGLRLPATTAFDYPTPVALARYLRDELGITAKPPATCALDALDRLEVEFEELSLEPDDLERIALRLRQLAAKWNQPGGAASDLELATDDEIFRLADAELDIP